MGKNSHKYTTVSIPIQLGEKLREFIKPTGFASMASFVTHVLRQILSEAPPYHPDSYEARRMKEDEEKVKERLKNLGYLK